MKPELLLAGGVGAILAATTAPEAQDFAPQETPAKDFWGTPLGAYGEGLVKGGLIVGGAVLAGPERGGMIVTGVGVFKLAQAALSEDAPNRDLQIGLSVALIALGAGLAFGTGKTVPAARAGAVALGAMGLVGTGLAIYRQNQANEASEKQLA